MKVKLHCQKCGREFEEEVANSEDDFICVECLNWDVQVEHVE